MKMFKTVWKYPLVPHAQFYDLPVNAQILSVAFQNDALMMWVEITTVDDQAIKDLPLERHQVIVCGTGNTWPADYKQARFLGTSMNSTQDFVVHAYEVLR